jgi:hypothetical protein
VPPGEVNRDVLLQLEDGGDGDDAVVFEAQMSDQGAAKVLVEEDVQACGQKKSPLNGDKFPDVVVVLFGFAAGLSRKGS